MGTLYIVATPIGNISDISLRAARTLLTADIIACEDTRKTGILLKEVAKLFSGYQETAKPYLISYYDQTELQKMPEIIELLVSGKDIVLVSDAGTPTISDPGFKLVRECAEKGIPIKTIPGPSAVVAALSVSGLPTDRFLFVGYPPKKDSNRQKFWRQLHEAKETLQTTIILYEAPHRILQTLDEMISTWGESQYIVVSRELTKIYEETRRGSLIDLKQHFQTNEPRGEFVILI
ncbi:MAG TPA: 16S rRNA (cytidine(1402)-2'-O)-methyltransferase [Patescibacteria group bacterium]|nr:16S rRNA (cytidine(1402)-2'-O)-methyltransferase [Patescibacteria group bacterium]